MTEWTINSNEALTLSLGQANMLTVHTAADRKLPIPLTVRSPADKAVLGEDETYEDFHPTFTYPVCTRLSMKHMRWFMFMHLCLCSSQIYGDDEKIYGYQDLIIDVRSPLLFLLCAFSNPPYLTLPDLDSSDSLPVPLQLFSKYLRQRLCHHPLLLLSSTIPITPS